LFSHRHETFAQVIDSFARPPPPLPLACLSFQFSNYLIFLLCSHLLRNPDSTWHDVPELPKAAIALLDSNFTLFSTKLIRHQASSDGETTKLLVELQDGLQVESVIMSYDTSTAATAAATALEAAENKKSTEESNDNNNDDTESVNLVVGGHRNTLCVSSEVGCQMGCTFCATGTMGLTADLTAGEIVEQLVHATRMAPIRNIVFMGMGEPLNNYAAVLSAVQLMTHPQAFALRRRCVTVSTVGVIPRITQLATDLPGVSLALSLHAPNQELRAKIVPSARAYKLDRLMETIEKYQKDTQQRVFIEYVMLGPDFNCLEEHARELGELLRGRDVVVNLIPWNPILSPGMDFKAPIAGATAAFQKILKEEYGLPSTLRQEKGQDVAAACGQLVLEHGGRGGSGINSNSGGCSGSGKGVADVEDLRPTARAAVF
jgi:adenine C2-methylase RlmN of 23S rRNA A2503 and tRNA A37